MTKKLKFLVPLFGILTALILSFTYFQQDEWHTFGTIQAYGFRYVTLDKNLFDLFTSDRVGARAIVYALFSLFGVSSISFAAFAITIHSFNSYLVYKLAKKLTKIELIPVISAAFFFLNSLGHQAYSWFGTVTGSATCVTFVLISLLFYFKFLEKSQFKNLLFSLFFIWVSFLFKESGYFIFLLYPLTWFLYEGRKIKLFFIKSWPLLLYGLLMTVILARGIIFIPGERANYISADTSGSIKLLTHLISYSLEGVGQSFVPFQFIFEAGKQATHIFKPTLQPDTPQFDLFYTTVATEAVVIVLSFAIIALFVFSYKKILKKDRQLAKFYLFSLSFLILSFFPYVVLDKFDAYLDSRYYYMGLVGSSFLFSILAVSITKQVKSFFRRNTFILFMSLIFLSHVFYLWSDMFYLAKVGLERRNIISRIQKEVPVLNSKTIFYITGNSGGYYGIEELKVPFQSGLGQVLLTVYGVKDKQIVQLFREDTLGHALDAGFLYDTLAQGYKEENGRGFGYFYDKDLLEEQISMKKFNRDDVASFFYDSNNNKIIKR